MSALFGAAMFPSPRLVAAKMCSPSKEAPKKPPALPPNTTRRAHRTRAARCDARLVSGISGAKTADMAAVAPVLFPEMRKRGLHDGEMVSLLAGVGAMAKTIPASLVLIAIGSVTGVSIAALFTGGLLPGVVLAIGLAVLARQRTAAEDMRGVKRASAATVLRTFVIAMPALVLPVLIRTAVINGVATATEVSTIGIA